MSVIRVYAAKKKEHAIESSALFDIFKENLNINSLTSCKILNRYDIEGLSENELTPLLNTVFSEPPADDLYIENYPFESNDIHFSVEYLPGQYDQRADSAMQCARVITGIEHINIRCAKTYVLKGNLSSIDIQSIKKYVINSVDSRLALEEKPTSLKPNLPEPKPVFTVNGFRDFNADDEMKFIEDWSLAMSTGDLDTVRNYFKNVEKRDPTDTEIRLLDTYWSDHCRHTTFNTVLKNIKVVSNYKFEKLIHDAIERYFEMRKDVYGEKADKKHVTLMDMATINAKYAKKHGFLDNLEISDENNACSIEIDVDTKPEPSKWLLQFKNETHNHPTEIEPYGGAATCLGGAIRDPLSGRAFVYQAMRITGAGDPREKISDTMHGKLPQRKLTKDAARGFSSYGNQIGLTTGYVQEFYHEGFKAKRLEAGFVIGAVPKSDVKRETPEAGDKIILVGGKTGRDGIGGATGSSKEHDALSIEVCGAEVQKGNAPEEHKIQRLFRKINPYRIIKKCNDFGAGGVGVAIGELADGLLINLNAVPKKYNGLSGTELAISESQERMAVVVSSKDVNYFISQCKEENLEATVVAEVTSDDRLRMVHDGRIIVDISRKFLNSAGAMRFQDVSIEYLNGDTPLKPVASISRDASFRNAARSILSSLAVCSQKGLIEMFDSTIGASSVLMPLGGKFGRTMAEYMAAKIPAYQDVSTISVVAAGYNPTISYESPFHGGVFAVIEAVSKIIASGAKLSDIRLSMQEYFEKLGTDSVKWGKPASALLGALTAQDNLNIAAIGGKDSMSGTFHDKKTGKIVNVPPTLIAFAVAPSNTKRIVTQEFKEAGCNIYLLKTPITNDFMPDFAAYKENASSVYKMVTDGVIEAIYTVKAGGIIEAAAKEAFGNEIAFHLKNISLQELAAPYYGSFIIVSKKIFDLRGVHNISLIGETIKGTDIFYNDEKVALSDLLEYYEAPLEGVFHTRTELHGTLPLHDYCERSTLKHAATLVRPQVAMLALPGTNCEYDMASAFERAKSREVKPFIFRNDTTESAMESCRLFADLINKSQILALPGGFSAGDEPEGSGKFFVSVFKNGYIRDAVSNLLENRDGLIIGICNGFQALLKIGLLTHGKICDLTAEDATLSFNTIGRHVSQMVNLRVSSVNSPWMMLKNIGDIDAVPVSHGEGRFTAPQNVIDSLFNTGQVLFQYIDKNGMPTMEFPYNPNGSLGAIEGICSQNGRVIGKMAHSERRGDYIHINRAYGSTDQKIFQSGVGYFTGKLEE